MRLRCSSGDLLRSLLAREPQWGHATPVVEVAGEDAVACYRLRPESFFVVVRFRRQGDQWVERDGQIVPGSTVALRFVLGDLQPARVTRALGIEPSRAWAKGDLDAPRSARHEGLWIREVLPASTVYAEEKVQELIGLLRDRASVRKLVEDAQVAWAGITVRLAGCREQMGGLALDRSLLADVADLGLALDVQVSAE
jgi:hypothetical protein